MYKQANEEEYFIITIITLSGTSNVSILIDGKPSLMSEDQLLALLRDTPVRDAAYAEIFYDTPPRYHKVSLYLWWLQI